MKNYMIILPLWLALLTLLSCNDEELGKDIIDTTRWETVKVAVVVPLSGDDSNDVQYKRISQYFEENANRAQHSWEDGIRLELEWYDEEKEDLSALVSSFASRSDLKAVIGPIKDENIELMANVLQEGPIPMFVMSASEELLRKYSCGTAGTSVKKPFLWSLCESDITQAQLMLYKISISGGQTVSLVSGANVYGDTYYKWVPYHAVESKLEMVDNEQYHNLSELESTINQMLASDTEYIICALNNTEEVKIVLEASHRNPNGPKLLFTGSVFKGNVMSLGSLTEGMEGFSLYSSPNTGFHLAYKQRFGESPKPYEAQFYDALLLSLTGAYLCRYGDMKPDMNEAVKIIADLSLTEENDFPNDYDWGKGTPVWDHYYLGLSVLSPIRTGRLPQLSLLGASGNLKFAAETFTTLVQSTYINWLIYNGKPVVLDYVAAKGTRVSNYQVAWLLQNTVLDEFMNIDVGIYYPALKDKWAVLVCGSKDWGNYRHQADLLNFYQFLKRHGMKDDRIILIMQDDIAHNEKNPFPGVIRSWPHGENLYRDFELDYKADSLSTADLYDIILGKKSSRLPVVLESTKNDNVLFYWTGHGTTGSFAWLDKESFTYSQLHEALIQMESEKRYRQLLLLAEPCRSSSMVKAVEGITGILGIASADEMEYSFADHYNSELGVWMCDRFTNNLVNELSKNSFIMFNELYRILNSSTMGSHVRIFNQQLFGNLHNSTIGSFY